MDNVETGVNKYKKAGVYLFLKVRKTVVQKIRK